MVSQRGLKIYKFQELVPIPHPHTCVNAISNTDRKKPLPAIIVGTRIDIDKKQWEHTPSSSNPFCSPSLHSVMSKFFLHIPHLTCVFVTAVDLMHTSGGCARGLAFSLSVDPVCSTPSFACCPILSPHRKLLIHTEIRQSFKRYRCPIALVPARN